TALYSLQSLLSIFFFQAEDGIRDGHVTGVQTCALPISPRFAHHRRHVRVRESRDRGAARLADPPRARERAHLSRDGADPRRGRRSEERRVGKECRSRGSAEDLKKKIIELIGGAIAYI